MPPWCAGGVHSLPGVQEVYIASLVLLGGAYASLVLLGGAYASLVGHERCT